MAKTKEIVTINLNHPSGTADSRSTTIMVDDREIDLSILSFGQFTELFHDAPHRRMTANQLRAEEESDEADENMEEELEEVEEAMKKEELLFVALAEGAEIRVYKSGYMICTEEGRDGKQYSTILMVSRCQEIRYNLNFSKKEKEEVWCYGTAASRITYRVIDRKLYKVHIIEEDKYRDLPWWKPILFIAEERLMHLDRLISTIH